MDTANIKREIIDFLRDLVIIIVIVLVLRTYLVEPFQISGQSMYESYYDKQFILVDRFSYLDIPYIKTWEIERWDVVVLRPWVDKDREYFIKRVIWVWWDTIKIEDGNVYLKTKWKDEFIELDESDYLTPENDWHTYVKWWAKIFEIPEWEFFIMWDNRNHSSDSRTCFSYSCTISSKDAYVEKDNIIWKVLLDLWYFNFRTFSFIHPELMIDTSPKWFSSLRTYDYNL